ncbi:MAG: MarC family protein [Elusimicrobiota bacterium]
MDLFLLAFLPLFVAIDPFGIIPLFLGFTEGSTSAEKKKLAIQAITTAFVVGLIFSIAGKMLFKILGVSPEDFQIGGGLLLLIYSIREIFGPTLKMTDNLSSDRLIGIVPLGVPLIAGPAMMTTILILHTSYGFWITTAALVANMAITLGFLLFSEKLVEFIGEMPMKALAKVVAIFLAAIGVMMIRKGVMAFF